MSIKRTTCYVFRSLDEKPKIMIIRADSESLSAYMTLKTWMCAGSCELTDAMVDIFKRRREYIE